MAILGDNAFCIISDAACGTIVKARKVGENGTLLNSIKIDVIDLLLQKLFPSERHFAVWSIRGINSPFARLKTILTGDAYKRYCLISICVHLYNLRVRHVGLNQI